MASWSILSLNDDCLINILSCLDDFTSFYNFALTCKRFHEVTLNPRDWHVNVAKRKAEFYIKQFIAYECHLGDLDGAGINKELRKLQLLVREARNCSMSPQNTFPKVVGLWKSCGLVAAKLYTWIKSSDIELEEGGRTKESGRIRKRLTIHLPNCDEDLTITTLYIDYVDNYSREITIKVSCGELNIEIKDLLIRSPLEGRSNYKQ